MASTVQAVQAEGAVHAAGAAGRALTLVEDKDRGVVKEVMKKGKAQLMERQLPWSRVTKWQARLEALEPEVQQLLEVCLLLCQLGGCCCAGCQGRHTLHLPGCRVPGLECA